MCVCVVVQRVIQQQPKDNQQPSIGQIIPYCMDGSHLKMLKLCWLGALKSETQSHVMLSESCQLLKYCVTPKLHFLVNLNTGTPSSFCLHRFFE